MVSEGEVYFLMIEKAKSPEITETSGTVTIKLGNREFIYSKIQLRHRGAGYIVRVSNGAIDRELAEKLVEMASG